MSYQLYKILKTKHEKSLYIDFDIREQRIIFNNKNEINKILNIKNIVAEKIIEYFMILANNCAANFLNKKRLIPIYRIHPYPNKENFNKIFNELKFIMPEINSYKQKNKISQKYIKYLLNEFKENETISDENKFFSNKLILSSMEKAIYSTKNNGHYAIGLKNYCHFTSPIRRYSDLFVHRVIKNYLNNKNNNNNQNLLDANLICFKLNSSEKRAQLCEKNILKIKKAKYLNKNKSKKFFGVISYINEKGFEVTLENWIDGFISISDLKDDYYIFDKNKNILLGKNKKKKYFIGKKITVFPKKINLYNGDVKFKLI